MDDRYDREKFWKKHENLPETINGKDNATFDKEIAELEKWIIKSNDLINKGSLENDLLGIKTMQKELANKEGKENNIRSDNKKWLFEWARLRKLDRKEAKIQSELNKKILDLRNKLIASGVVFNDPLVAKQEAIKEGKYNAIIKKDENGNVVYDDKAIWLAATDFANAAKSGNTWLMNSIAQKVCQWQNMWVDFLTTHTVMNQREARWLVNIWTTVAVGVLAWKFIKAIFAWDWKTIGGFAAGTVAIWALLKYLDPNAREAAIAASVGSNYNILPEWIDKNKYKKWAFIFDGFYDCLRNDYQTWENSKNLYGVYFKDWKFNEKQFYSDLTDDTKNEDNSKKFDMMKALEFLSLIHETYEDGEGPLYDNGVKYFIDQNNINLDQDDGRTIKEKSQLTLRLWLEQNYIKIEQRLNKKWFRVIKPNIYTELATVYNDSRISEWEMSKKLQKIAENWDITLILKEWSNYETYINNTYEQWKTSPIKAKWVDNVVYKGEYWSEAIAEACAFANNEIRKLGINEEIIIYPDVNWELYVQNQNDRTRTSLQVMNWWLIYLEAMNEAMWWDIADAIFYAAVANVAKTYFGTLPSKFTEGKLDSAKFNVNWFWNIWPDSPGIDFPNEMTQKMSNIMNIVSKNIPERKKTFVAYLNTVYGKYFPRGKFINSNEHFAKNLMEKKDTSGQLLWYEIQNNMSTHGNDISTRIDEHHVSDSEELMEWFTEVKNVVIDHFEENWQTYITVWWVLLWVWVWWVITWAAGTPVWWKVLWMLWGWAAAWGLLKLNKTWQNFLSTLGVNSSSESSEDADKSNNIQKNQENLFANWWFDKNNKIWFPDRPVVKNGVLWLDSKYANFTIVLMNLIDKQKVNPTKYWNELSNAYNELVKKVKIWKTDLEKNTILETENWDFKSIVEVINNIYYDKFERETFFHYLINNPTYKKDTN